MPSSHLPFFEGRQGYSARRRDGAVFGRVGGVAMGGVTIPPVVARIFSGDSTSPLTRVARVLAIFEG